ncbi:MULTISPECIES: STAS domain-containing protein [Rhodobacterales]|jgi:anti-sigma B factor antagonist|uniref:Anti-sigma factor antagonist n=1 Tax=Phaeobacter gallaeciensis TaxID=60890 RepID=A0A1B0ZS36_9RHOB|nr:MULTISPECIES: STAS domain-containing protein [Phaeobacter]MDF1773226.1 STAS domain-containing protein [Pseudophaeobacter sp. bin_em_oilr2.035]MEC9312055.1 STAS domain-containing protein [Pseudomonadota bacterium]ANP36956.1 anti-sigma factor antagonist [Phaeobacter gallaeciensis]MDE4060928.1 STAS domain-containing protein [Phaeobacter gallaeciensis]MDE4097914.1 STAS domain-containing protein [Phaeobacter gallaeciensis]
MSLSSTVTDGAQIVTVNAERIDAAIAIRFKEDMRSATESGPDRVILDLSEVQFIDSSGLGAIVAAMKQLGSGRRLDLAGPTPMVEKVFRLTRMDTIFDLYGSLTEAMSEPKVGT